jgi:hypothetical protein
VIKDEEVRAWRHRPLVGSVDTLSDNPDFLVQETGITLPLP